MRNDPDLERLVNVVVDGLTAIDLYAALAQRNPQNFTIQEQALEIIQCTARQSARRLQDYMRSRGA